MTYYSTPLPPQPPPPQPAPPGWSPHGWGRPDPAPVHYQVVPPSRLPVVAVVLASVALLLAVAAGIAVLAGGSGGGSPLTGQLSEVRAGAPVAGPDLESEVTQVIEDDGGYVDRMTCPDVPAVAQGVVSVCHGAIDGSEWAVVVFFEDANGRITLLPT
jgi:hypothetical protein